MTGVNGNACVESEKIRCWRAVGHPRPIPAIKILCHGESYDTYFDPLFPYVDLPWRSRIEFCRRSDCKTHAISDKARVAMMMAYVVMTCSSTDEPNFSFYVFSPFYHLNQRRLASLVVTHAYNHHHCLIR